MNKTTFMAKPGQVERKWYVVDATDVPLGRLSAVVASVLRGKNKPISAGELRSKNAVRLIEKSVKGMLPHNTLGRAQGMKLKVFVGAEHTHAAQQPEVLDISGLI